MYFTSLKTIIFMWQFGLVDTFTVVSDNRHNDFEHVHKLLNILNHTLIRDVAQHIHA